MSRLWNMMFDRVFLRSTYIRGGAIFVGIVLVSFFILSQGEGLLQKFHVIKVATVFDSGSWEKAIKTVADTGTLPEDDFAYGYPAGPILFPAAFLVDRGIDVHQAYIFIIAALAALALGAIASVAYVLRPDTPWWLGAPGILMLHDLYSLGTPPSLVVSFLVALIALLTLLIREQQGTKVGWWSTSFLGIAAALALSTRLDISILFLACVAVYLFFYARKHLYVSILIASGFFILCDPFLWMGPVEHVLAIYHKITFHYAERSWSTPLNAMGLYFSVGLLGFFAACAVHARHARESVPVDFFYWLSATASVLFVVLSFMPYQPNWYFFPVIALLEVFSILFVLSYVEAVSRKTLSIRHQYLCIGLFLAFQLWLSLWSSDNMDLFVSGPTLWTHIQLMITLVKELF